VRLYINIDHVATVRQARLTDEPDPVRAAVLAELGGADGITVHLREDRRHIQDRDVRLLMETVRTVVNLEIATAPEVVDLALEWRPAQVTLVPERREEVTTEGGLDLSHEPARMRDALQRLADAGIRTSLFIAPDRDAVERSRELGAAAIELHTGTYAHHPDDAAAIDALLQAEMIAPDELRHHRMTHDLVTQLLTRESRISELRALATRCHLLNEESPL